MYSELQGANQCARMRWPIGTYVVRRYLSGASHTMAPMNFTIIDLTTVSTPI